MPVIDVVHCALTAAASRRACSTRRPARPPRRYTPAASLMPSASRFPIDREHALRGHASGL
jgi:hypothetical protein